jgi:hypothetical protein
MATADTGVYSRDPFAEGVWAGLARCAREGLAAPREDIDGQLDLLRGVLAPADASERFVALFAEMATIAAVARFTYEEVPIDADQMNDYLERSFGFFNSFRHP